MDFAVDFSVDFCPSFKGTEGPKKSIEKNDTKIHDKIHALRMNIHYEECSAEGEKWSFFKAIFLRELGSHIIFLSVKSPALILSKNSGVSLAKKAEKNRLRSAKIGQNWLNIG